MLFNSNGADAVRHFEERAEEEDAAPSDVVGVGETVEGGCGGGGEVVGGEGRGES